MGKKGKKTRWRRLPIGGSEEEGGISLESQPPVTDPHRITFNEDEYTKITTPRQDVLFKKGYFGRKRTPNPCPSETQEVHSGDSVESESYVSEEPQYAYPTGYMDPNGGLYYVNGNTFETYDPYTGTVTVVVGPAAQYPGGAPVLAALPCQPVPLQPLEWFNPPAPAPWCYSYNRKKRYSTDSQNCSAQSSESTGPPGSPQEPVDEGACAMYPPQYVYPGYMFGPPIYNMNGVTVQGMIPQPVPMQPDLSASKRRKKRRRRRRGGVTDDGSESSCCEEPLTCDVPGCQSETSSDAVCQSGASSDAGAGPNSDSGINTDPTPNSGSNSPPLDLAQVTESVSKIQFQCHQQQPEPVQLSANKCNEYQPVVSEVPQEPHILSLCSNTESVDECVFKDDGRSQDEVTTPEEASEELSTTEDDVTPNLCDAAPEFSSQESTLSCLSTPSVHKDLMMNEQEISSVDVSQEEVFESCQSFTELISGAPTEEVCKSVSYNDLNCQTASATDLYPTNCNDDLKTFIGDENESQESVTKTTENTSNNEKEELSENSNKENEDSTEVHTSASLADAVQCIDVSLVTETSLVFEEEKATEEVCWNAKEICLNFAEPVCEILSTTFQGVKICEISHSDLRFLPSKDTLAPVPPPRRKRSMSRAADKLATRIVEEAIKEGIEEAVCTRLRSPISITEAVTRWLNSQGSSPLTCPPSDTESDDDDEGIEDGEGSTDQKNVRGNPFPVSSPSGSGQRVAKDCESMVSSAGEWDLWDHSHTREMSDPARSVDKYYRLGADENVGDKVPPSVYKTAMHIRHTGPFPCGVCCIIQ